MNRENYIRYEFVDDYKLLSFDIHVLWNPDHTSSVAAIVANIV